MSLLEVATPLTVLPSVSCQDAIDIMNKEGFDQLPVVDQAGSVMLCDLALSAVMTRDAVVFCWLLCGPATLNFSTGVCRNTVIVSCDI